MRKKKMTKHALIIFTRNPELGKVKTRIAKSVGDESALNIYKHLLKHTANVSKNVKADRFIFYSEVICEQDIWNTDSFIKKLQKGKDLGERMSNAFKELFILGYSKVIIIGSDLLDLSTEIIEEAFNKLNSNDLTIGPALDGGYYLLGMKSMNESVFDIENWGTNTVYKQTISKLNENNVYVLEVLNDIDYIEDLKPYKDFESYFKKI